LSAACAALATLAASKANTVPIMASPTCGIGALSLLRYFCCTLADPAKAGKARALIAA
jgi:hypothetical protein